MRLFKNTWFSRFAKKEGITDEELRETVNKLEAGHADADLGSGVYKVRIARPGEGKSGGYRVIVFFKSEGRTFYAYGFPKSGMDNINEKQLRNFKLAAKTVFNYSDEEINERVKNGLFIEFY
ncbi:MAG: type II toxin-antitoxin system RelE/ParE family toxin [Treponema sp.]|nr:type II toxin-antitoxin system RelE/ParE family toxin [Treponema sp.]